LYRQIFADRSELDWFLSHVCTMEWHLRHDQGVPMADNAEALKAKHPEYADEIDAWRLRFGEMLGGEIEGVDAMIDAIAARGLRQGLLTNMPREVAELCFDGFTRLGCFNGVTVSGFEKVAKPDPEAFRRALNAMGAAAEETFFIDDSQANIDAAERLGLGVHRFVDTDGLKIALRKAGILG
jgi:HAD superfamily hydrolase (TIGR01509 family)